MRLTRLELLAYGPFTDQALDFSEQPGGLHVVCGLNEAGKSTALRAIHGLLFGIPPRCTDNQLHPNPSLRIGAVLENGAGRQLWVVRKKGNKKTLLNPEIELGGAFPDDVLKPFLGEIDGPTFERIYGIDHAELRAGGQAMKSLKGLVGESLFAATIGGAGLANLLQQLDQEAAGIYDSAKRKPRLTTAKREYLDLEKQRKQQRLSNTEWTRLQSQLTQATVERRAIVDRTTRLKESLVRWQRFEQAQPLIARRKEIESDLQRLGEVQPLPATYSRERRCQLQSELNDLETRVIASLVEQLDGPDGLRHVQSTVEVPEGLLEFSEEIASLKDERAVHAKARQDIEKLARDCEGDRARIAELMEDLGLPGSFDVVQQHRVAIDELVRIRNLANEEKVVRAAPRIIRERLEKLRRDLAESEHSLANLGGIQEVGPLVATLQAIDRLGELPSRCDRERRQLDEMIGEATVQLGALRPWSGSLSSVLDIQLPLDESIDRFEARGEPLDRKRDDLQKQKAEEKEQLRELRESIERISRFGTVPTEEQLTRLRELRDATWARVRERWLDDRSDDNAEAVTRALPGDESQRLASEYESAVREADLLVDRLRRETERVAELARCQAECSRREATLREIEVEEKACHQIRIELDVQWRKLWQDARFESPQSPREMRAWMTKVHSLQQMARVVERQRAELAECQSQLEAARGQMKGSLSEYGVTFSPSATFEELRNTIEQFIEQQRQSAARQRELERERAGIAAEIVSAEADESLVNDELERWMAEWQPAMARLGSRAEATAEEAQTRMDALKQVFDLVRDEQRKQKRIADMQRDLRDFAGRAKRLADRHLEPDDDNDSLAHAALLAERLERAKTADGRRRDLCERIGKSAAQLDAAYRKAAELRTQLDALVRLAAAKQIGDLPEIEKRWESYQLWVGKLTEVDEHLRPLAREQSIARFVAEANAYDGDALRVQIDEAETQIGLLEQQRDDAVRRESQLQNELQGIDGDAAAAEADESALGVLSMMHDDARRFLTIRLAAVALRNQIETHRALNEDPLLRRASQLFARMTCNEFAGLRTDYDSQSPVLVGERRVSGELVPVSGMSGGTRDQLFLALRLAYVEKQLRERTPLPFIVDDILIEFDDERAQATLEILADLGRQTQVLLFTHHGRLIELASQLASDACRIHHLQRR